MMSNTRLAKIVFLALFIISIIIPLLYLDKLPERIASHFDFNNRADGWMSKSGYLLFHYGIILFFYFLFWGLSTIVPKFHLSLINIPNKEYWLHETRKGNTFKVLQAMLLWIGSLCLALFVYIFYEILKANADGSQQISNFSWVSLFIFLSLTAFIVVKYIIYFSQKENQLEE